MPDVITETKTWAWKEAMNYGLAVVVLSVGVYTLWNTNATLTNYIQTELITEKDKHAQESQSATKIIEQNSEQLKQNSQQLMQNSQVLESVLDNNAVTLEVVNKALDRIEEVQQ